MRISSLMPVAVVVLAGVVAGATTRSREAPSPSEKSRANDTPVVDHMPGGGPSGGAVVGLAVVADRPGTVFAAFEHGGVFRSHDYGMTWTPADRGLPAEIGCELRTVPGEPATLYAACFDDLFKTTNAGALWKQLDVDHTRLPLIAPSDSRVVYQPPFHEVIRSLDAGRRWERLVPSVPLQCDRGMTIHPARATSLFCTSEDGLSSSRDGGRTWNPTGARLPSVPRTSLVISPTDPDTFFVGGEDGHLWRSRDAGRTWARLDVDKGDDDPRDDGARDEWDAVEYVGSTTDVLVGLHGDRIVRSRDAGEHWERLATSWPSGIMPAPFVFDPSDPWTVYVGTASGVMVTRDFGQTWTRRSAGISRITASVALHEGPATTTLYAIGSEWSDAAEIFTSTDDGQTWETGVPAPMPRDAAVHTLRSDGFGGLTVTAGGQYHHLRRGQSRWLPLDLPPDARLLPGDLASQASLLVAAGPDGYLLSDDSGRSWQRGRLPGPWGPRAAAATVGRGRVLFMSTTALPFITGTDALPTNVGTWRSLDDGRTWEPTGPLLDMHRFETVLAAPHAEGTVFVSATGINSDRAVIHRSTDRGATWKELHVPGLASALVLVPTRPTTVLALPVGFQQSSPLMASTDAGTAWRPAGAGLPHGIRLTNIVSDPRDPRRLFAGTRGRGVYRSMDAGATWTAAGTATSHDK